MNVITTKRFLIPVHFQECRAAIVECRVAGCGERFRRDDTERHGAEFERVHNQLLMRAHANLLWAVAEVGLLSYPLSSPPPNASPPPPPLLPSPPKLSAAKQAKRWYWLQRCRNNKLYLLTLLRDQLQCALRRQGRLYGPGKSLRLVISGITECFPLLQQDHAETTGWEGYCVCDPGEACSAERTVGHSL